MPDNPKPASQTPAIHSVHIEQQDAHVWAYLDSFSRHGGRGGIASLDDAKRLWAMADGLDRMTDELDEIEALPRATTFLDKDARRKRIDELKALIHPEPATEGAAPEPQAAPAVPVTDTQPQAATPKPVTRAAAQDAAILAAIADAGHNPLQLPANESGKPGVSSAVRKALKGNSLFVGSTVFGKAWERLSKAGDIAYKT